jgi:hypothetical protein
MRRGVHSRLLLRVKPKHAPEAQETSGNSTLIVDFLYYSLDQNNGGADNPVPCSSGLLTDARHLNCIPSREVGGEEELADAHTIDGEWPRILFSSLFPASTSHGGQVSWGYRKTLALDQWTYRVLDPGQKGPNLLLHFRGASRGI